jgi:GT2 family glycosyltransferase
LAKCLESISLSVSRSRLAVEVICVANASLEATELLIKTWAATQPFTVKSLFVPQPGVSRARNAALEIAEGDIIALTDDDCRVEPDYIDKLYSAFFFDEGPIIRGGRVELGDKDDIPLTIQTSRVPAQLRIDQFPGGFINGSSFAFSRSVYLELGPYDERFGPGSTYPAADDTDYMVRALAAGIPVRFDPSFSVEHHHGRRGDEAMRRMRQAYSYADGAMFAKHFLSRKSIRRIFGRSFLSALLSVLRAPPRDAVIPRLSLFKFKHQLRGFLAYIAAEGPSVLRFSPRGSMDRQRPAELIKMD